MMLSEAIEARSSLVSLPSLVPLPSASTSPARFGLDSEYGRLRSVMLASPDELELIACNSVSAQSARDGREPCLEKARRQHALLVMALEDEGVDVHIAPARPGLPDLTFTRDTSLMTPWGLVGLSPGATHRRKEVDAIFAAARDNDIPIAGRIGKGRIEGGDIALVRPGILAIGVSGERTDDVGAEALGGLFKGRGWHILTCRFDPHFLHLDTQFCMVDRNLAVACTDVLDDTFLAQLAALDIDLIETRYKDVRKLGCNLLALGDRRVITTGDCSGIDRALALRGYRVIAVDLSEFTMCGGGAHCLTMPLARDPG